MSYSIKTEIEWAQNAINEAENEINKAKEKRNTLTGDAECRRCAQQQYYSGLSSGLQDWLASLKRLKIINKA